MDCNDDLFAFEKRLIFDVVGVEAVPVITEFSFMSFFVFIFNVFVALELESDIEVRHVLFADLLDFVNHWRIWKEINKKDKLKGGGFNISKSMIFSKPIYYFQLLRTMCTCRLLDIAAYVCSLVGCL